MKLPIARLAVCAAALLLALPAAATSWDPDGLRIEASPNGTIVDIHVDADRYEGLTLDAMSEPDARWLQIDAGSTVGCGQLDADDATVCWRSAYAVFRDGIPLVEGRKARLLLHAGSIRQPTITRVITVQVQDGQLRLGSIEPLKVTP
ncbi:hypothetical protein [Asticcacaulis sp.]|uniref:hypothetical protein n=1 Tax=Asticcacaulis sp. TaxID=1872648 RepID=UPI00260392F6|nr:hypothetical protein [Asticcacaulis sp.]